MIQSMTAFARTQADDDSEHLCWEIKSVNHRFLDVSFRLPEPFRYLEPQFRLCLRDKISRGKLECQLKYQDTSSNNQSMLINKGMINALIDLSNDLSVSHQLANDISVSTIIAWPGVVQMGSPDMEKLGQRACLLLNKAIEQLVEARINEGCALKSHIEMRLQALQDEVKCSKELVLQLNPQIKEKLLAQLNTLKVEVSEQRVEQEVALILTKLDVSEEFDRLETHIKEVARILAKESIAGRKLDFLMQELNREANTLSSKSDSVQLTQSAVEMKVLIEQMREQIQNVE